MSRRTRRTFTAEFKEQIVKLYHTGKKVSYLSIEYDLSEQQIYHWIRQYNNSQSCKEADNRTEEEKELIRLRKEVQQLRMENDILKQAALIMGRKSNL